MGDSRSKMWAEVKIHKLKFKVRVDRIDNIHEKYHLLIDYKTGKQPTTRKALFSNDLTDLQIPIYACFVPLDNLIGVAIGHMNRDKINLYGITSPNVEIITKQLSSKIDHPDINDWESLLSLWQKHLEKLAEQFLSGDVSVTFNEKIDFTYCDILPLSISILSPVSQNKGTINSKSVLILACLRTFPEVVSPFTAGSV